MYSYEQADEVGQVLAGMPIGLLERFAELIAFLELTPWTGRPFQPRNPEGNLRKMVFGPNSEALLVYLILENSGASSRSA